jgi:hypothetical protein
MNIIDDLINNQNCEVIPFDNKELFSHEVICKNEFINNHFRVFIDNDRSYLFFTQYSVIRDSVTSVNEGHYKFIFIFDYHNHFYFAIKQLKALDRNSYSSPFAVVLSELQFINDYQCIEADCELVRYLNSEKYEIRDFTYIANRDESVEFIDITKNTNQFIIKMNDEIRLVDKLYIKLKEG